MPSLQSYLVRYLLHYRTWKKRNKEFTLAENRRYLDYVGAQCPMFPKTEVERVSVRGIAAEWIRTPGHSKHRKILYLHGGAYQRGSLNSHRNMVSHIAEACRAEVLVLDYRLAPEHPFPAAVDDAVSAYEFLNQSYPEADLIIGGDSAGAGLSLACMLKLKEENISLPKAALLMAPWVDLEGKSDSLDRLAKKDPFLKKEGLLDCARQYYGSADPTNPYVSPIHADLSGFPPLLVQVGTLDILLDEGKQIAQNAQKAGVEVDLQVWKNMIHVWQILVKKVPESLKAIKAMGTFLDRHLKE